MFENFKARLVTGGDRQDKGLYENLSSPTAATSSVLSVAAIAASEGRSAITIDIGGAFLNADIAPNGVKVHMRLNSIMTQMLIEIDESYKSFVEADGSMIVQLYNAASKLLLYGTRTSEQSSRKTDSSQTPTMRAFLLSWVPTECRSP